MLSTEINFQSRKLEYMLKKKRDFFFCVTCVREGQGDADDFGKIL